MDKYIIVFSTVPDKDSAHKITQAILTKRLAACITITPAVQSSYWWQGKITMEEELQLVIKTQDKLYSRLEKMILQLHPYEVPEIIALPVIRGYSQYLGWVEAETSSSADGEEF